MDLTPKQATEARQNLEDTVTARMKAEGTFSPEALSAYMAEVDACAPTMVEVPLFPVTTYAALQEAWLPFARAAYECTPTTTLIGDDKVKADLLRYQLAQAVKSMIETLEEMGEVVTR